MTELDYGKKIFFICPNSFIINEIIFPLIDQEFETYIIEDHKLISLIDCNYPGSILFINIDEKLTSSQWESLILSFPRLNFGILTYNKNKNTELKYKTMLSIPCGYNSLRERPENLLKNITNSLNSFETIEKRKCIRISFTNKENLFKLSIRGIEQTGYIRDISSKGVTLVLKKPLKIAEKRLLSDISLYIHDSIVIASGIFIGAMRNEENELIYIIIFDNTMKKSSKSRIKRIINRTLQKEMIADFKIPIV